MSRKLFILIIALFCFALSASGWADEAEDVKQIKELLNKEGWAVWHGEVDKVLSCYAPGFVGYSASPDSAALSKSRYDGFTTYNDPEEWAVSISTPDELRKYASQNLSKTPRSLEDFIAKHPDWKGGQQIRHVHVKGDHALAIARYWSKTPDLENRETIYGERRTVWLLSRIKGEWKITSWIGGISSGQRVTKWGPPE